MIVIAGAGGTGKTSIATKIAPDKFLSLDCFRDLEWSRQSDVVALLMERGNSSDVFEGFSAARGLRKYLANGNVPEERVMLLLMTTPYAKERYRQVDADAQTTICRDIVSKYPSLVTLYVVSKDAYSC